MASLAVGGLAVQAEGAVTTFNNRASWQAAAAALGTIQTEGFESQPTGTLVVGPNDLGLATLTIGLVGTTTTTGASITSGSPIDGTRELSLNADTNFRTYDFTFDGGDISAAGFNFTGAATGGIAAARIDGQLFVFGNNPPSGNGFFGFISDAPVTGFSIEDGAPGVPSEVFDSDLYSFVTAVPEPGSAGLLAVLALAARRRRQ